MRARRESRNTQSAFGARPGQSTHNSNSFSRPAYSNPFVSNDSVHHRSRTYRSHRSSGGDSEEDDGVTDDRTPLMSTTNRDRPTAVGNSGYGGLGSQSRGNRPDSQVRRPSTATSRSSQRRRRGPTREPSHSDPQQDYDVNNPPSVPNSPKLGPEIGYDDVLLTGSFGPSRSMEDRRATAPALSDHIINIDGGPVTDQTYGNSSPPTPRGIPGDQRRRTIALQAEEDVCFPLEGMSEMAEDDYMQQDQGSVRSGTRRRRSRRWPDLSVLEEWSREEKEVRSEGIRAKKISEPVLVGGRLRPQKNGWHRTEEDAPYRFTYFNEEFQSTIHSQTISELLQPDQTFKELFIPDPPELSDESSDEDDDRETSDDRQELSPTSGSKAGTRHSSVMGESKSHSRDQSGDATPLQSQQPKQKPKRYGARPTFWLDVLSPTETEMRVISKTFGIHPLSAEDIMVQEAREKVELFRNYYFVNYRTFEQDMNSEDFLEPVNMYVVVFREGVISFHFSMTPHPANVRRRIRQLKDYLILSSDWISYAIIDDITDVFAPLIQSIEDEVDDIDAAILQLHSGDKDESSNGKSKSKDNEKKSESGDATSGDSGGDMLRRVGEARKKVMGLYRLLGNKADVIKGFAKRCNQQWEIAPKSEIGLYLGDIQDHILTMTSNLSHYETLLSRAHSNYLAQINIRMNERQEQTADVLGKLTVLGTIVLPMNIITGMWGMNVEVPGQKVDNQYWFWSITAGLLVFGISCFFIAKRV
ncbi:MAG: CorA metal ion transporter, partial [Pleopsidium flavum]